jgi:hypothetical protein
MDRMVGALNHNSSYDREREKQEYLNLLMRKRQKKDASENHFILEEVIFFSQSKTFSIVPNT